jgi:hypothetical protein
MRGADLPTREEIFTRAQGRLSEAYRALGDAQDELRSDWRPVGTELTDEQADLRARMQREIAAAKDAINRARP